MKRSAYILTMVGLLVLFAGCKKQESDADGVRAALASAGHSSVVPGGRGKVVAAGQLHARPGPCRRS